MSIFAFLMVFCGALSLSDCLELPPYIKPCSLTDPGLIKCSVESANAAIPHLIKGEKDYGIKAVNPLTLADAKLRGEELSIDLLNVTGDVFKNLKIEDIQFDYEAKEIGFDATIDKFTLSGKYSITDSKIGEYRVHGHGDFIITLVGNIMDFKGEVYTYEKEKEMYFEIINSHLSIDTERVYFFFKNLQARDDLINMNEYIDENWGLVLDEIKPSMEKYFLEFVQVVCDGISNNVPFSKIYKP